MRLDRQRASSVVISRAQRAQLIVDYVVAAEEFVPSKLNNCAHNETEICAQFLIDCAPTVWKSISNFASIARAKTKNLIEKILSRAEIGNAAMGSLGESTRLLIPNSFAFLNRKPTQNSAPVDHDEQLQQKMKASSLRLDWDGHSGRRRRRRLLFRLGRFRVGFCVGHKVKLLVNPAIRWSQSRSHMKKRENCTELLIVGKPEETLKFSRPMEDTEQQPEQL